MKHKTVIKIVTFICATLLSVANANAEAGHDHAAHGDDHSAHSEKQSEHAHEQAAHASDHAEHSDDDSAHAESHGEHGHEHVEKKAGPNGGRLISIVEPHLEFLVTDERFVQITFLGHDGEVVPVDEQVVSAIGGKRSAPTKVKFVKKEGRLISTEALPEMKSMPIILQIKTTPTAKSVRATFYLNMSDCPSCDYKEYSCVCGH